MEEGSITNQASQNNLCSDSNLIKPQQQSALLKCKYCLKHYKLVGALTTHERCCPQKNNETKSGESHKNATDDKTCKVCGQKFKYAKILQKHELIHKDKNKFWCKLCMLSFMNYEEKMFHKLNVHPTKAKKSKCKSCPNLTFASEEEYLYHVSEAHKGKFEDYFMCSECGKQFRTKTELTHHNNSKCGTVRQYKCQICNQELMTAGSLHNHMLRHKGERSSMCDYCGKTFLSAGQLKVHERSHTQEKAFICQICGKGFCHRQSLITHSSIHTGIKPYVCDNCSQGFSCVGNLMKHRKTHADTCGLVPSTTHRVNHPMTKKRVQMNTPKNSKLKAVAREKERLEKVAAYKEKIGQQNGALEEKSSENLKCSVQQEQQQNEMNMVLMDDVFELQIKLDNEETKHTSSAISEGFVNCINKQQQKDEKEYFNLSNSFQDYSHQFPSTYDGHHFTTAHKMEEGAFDDVYTPAHRDDVEIGIVKGDNVNDDHCFSNEGQYTNGDCSDEKAIKNCEKLEERTNPLSEVRRKRPQLQKENGGQMDPNKSIKVCCRYCGKMYSNTRWLIKHEEEHQKKTEKPEIKTKSSPSFKCSCCKVGFETRDECKTHQQSAHANILTCHDCDKVFSNLDSLRSHQNIFHKGVPKKVYIYICDKCGMQFRQKAFLTHHEQNNCGSEPMYKCHVCGKGFSSVYTRRSHLRIHDPKKRFLCKFCGKSFRWKGQLKIHERSHTGEKPFKCLYCPKAFAYRESLLTHSTIHTGIKPHLCQACGSRFSCIGNLIKHRGTHASCAVWYSKNQ